MNTRALPLVAAHMFLPTLLFGYEPQWPNDPGHNRVLQARELPAALTETEQLWQVTWRAKSSYSSPVITDDLVLIAAESSAIEDQALLAASPKFRGGAVYAFDRSTGARRWELLEGPGGSEYGFTSAPVVQGNRAYIIGSAALCFDLGGQADGNLGPYMDELTLWSNKPWKGENVPLTTLLTSYGDVIWRFDINNQMFKLSNRYRVMQDAWACQALLLGEQLWFSTSHATGTRPSSAWAQPQDREKWNTTKAAYLMVVNANTGAYIASDNVVLPEVFHGNWSSLSAAPELGVVVWCDGYGFARGFSASSAISGTLEQIWETDLNPHTWRYDEAGNERPYPQHHECMQRYNLMKKGIDLWTVGPSDIISTPAVVDGKVYVGTGRDHFYSLDDPNNKLRDAGAAMFYCLDAATGKILWQQEAVGRGQCNPSVWNGHVYIADMAGWLTCMNAETGAVVFRTDLNSRVTCRSQVVADGKVYIQNDRKEMFIIDADPSQNGRVLWTGKLSDEGASIGAVDGLLVVTTPHDVTAYTKR